LKTEQKQESQIYKSFLQRVLFHSHSVRYTQPVSSPCTARRYNLASTLGAHTQAVTVFIDPFLAAWLKCPFHCYVLIGPLVKKRPQM